MVRRFATRLTQVIGSAALTVAVFAVPAAEASAQAFTAAARPDEVSVKPVLKFPDVTFEATGWELVNGITVSAKFTLRNLGGAPANNIQLKGTCNYLASNYLPERSFESHTITPGSTISVPEHSMYWIRVECPKQYAAGSGLVDNVVVEALPLPGEINLNNNVMIEDVYNYQPIGG